MTTANLSVGINTSKAKSDLRELLDDMQTQVNRTGLKKINVDLDTTKIADSLSAVLRSNTLNVSTTQAVGEIDKLQRNLENTIKGLNISLGDFSDKFANSVKGINGKVTSEFSKTIDESRKAGKKSAEAFNEGQQSVENIGYQLKFAKYNENQSKLGAAYGPNSVTMAEGLARAIVKQEELNKLGAEYGPNYATLLKGLAEAVVKQEELNRLGASYGPDGKVYAKGLAEAVVKQEELNRKGAEYGPNAQTYARGLGEALIRQEELNRKGMEFGPNAHVYAKGLAEAVVKQEELNRKGAEYGPNAQTMVTGQANRAVQQRQEQEKLGAELAAITERRIKQEHDQRQADIEWKIKEDIREEREKEAHLKRMAELNARFMVSSPESKLATAKLAQAYSSQGLDPAQKVGTAAASLGNAAGITKLEAEAAQAARGVSHLAGSMRDAHSAARGLAAGFHSMWLTWGNVVPLMAGFALSTAVKESITGFAQVEYQMTFVKGLTENTTQSVKELSKSMHETALALGIGPVQAAEGLRALTQAGLDTKTAMASLPDVFKLATVGELTMADAAISATGISNAFHLSMNNISHVGDVLALAGAKSATSVSSMTESMKMASVVASQYGLQLEEVSVVLTALAKRNITGTSAGTAAKNMFNELATPQSTDAKKAAKELNFNAYTGEGADRKMRPILDQVEELRGKLAVYDKESQGKLMRAMFGERGDKAIGALLAMSKQELADLNTELKNSDGFTTGIFMQLQQTLQGQFGLMKSQVMNTFSEIGETASTPLIDMARKIKDAFASEELKSALRGLTQSVVSVGMAAIQYGPYILTFFVAFKSASMALEGALALQKAWAALTASTTMVVGASTAAANSTGLLRVAMLSLANPITAVTAAAAAAVGIWYLLKERQEASIDVARREVKAIEDTTEALRKENDQSQKKLDLRKQGIVGEAADKKTAVDMAQQKANDIESQMLAARTLGNNGEADKLEKQYNMAMRAVAELDDQQKRYQRISRENEALAKKEQADKDKESAGNLPSGNKSYKPNTDASSMAAQERNEAVEKYRHMVELAKQWHDADVAILDDQLKKKLIAEETYQSQKKAIDDKYEGKRTEAYDSAKDFINTHARSKMDKDSQRKSLDNSIQKMKDQNAEAAQKDEVGTHKSVQLESNNFMSEAKKIIDKSKELSDKVTRDINKIKEQRGIQLMSAEDRAALEASVRVESEFQVEIDKANQKLEEAKAHYKGNTVEVVKLANAIEKMKEAQRDAAEEAAKAARDDAEYKKTAEYGWDAFWRKYQDGATTSAKVVEDTLGSVTNNMTSMVMEFTKTGKLNWKSMAASILQDMVKLETQYMLSKIFGKGGFDLSDGPLTGMMSKIGGLLSGSKGNNSGFGFGDMKGAAGLISGKEKPLSVMSGKSGLKGSPSLEGSTDISGGLGGLKDSVKDLNKEFKVLGTDVTKSAEGLGGMSSVINESGDALGTMQTATQAVTAAKEVETVVSESAAVAKELELGASTQSVVSDSMEATATVDLATVQTAVAAQEAALLLAANGASFGGTGAEYFANGGAFTNKVYSTPTPFKFASGGKFNQGVMGEAGPEAVMPLARDSQGRLGVRYQPMQDVSQGQNTSQPAPPAPNNIRIVNAFDTNVISDHMGSAEGERVIMNVIKKNPTIVKRLVKS